MPQRKFYAEKIYCPDLKDDGHKHIIFRKKFSLGDFETAKAFTVSDGYCELYINGFPTYIVPGDGVCRSADVGDYLMSGENVFAMHTRFEDLNGGVRFELEVDDKRVLLSDGSFLCAVHDGYTLEHDIDGEIEIFDSRSKFVGFESPYFTDDGWKKVIALKPDQTPIDTVTGGDTVPERPVSVKAVGNVYSISFDGKTAGSLFLAAKGKCGSVIKIGTDKAFKVNWILSGDDDMLDLFRFESIKTAAVFLPMGAVLEKDDIRLRLPGKK